MVAVDMWASKNADVEVFAQTALTKGPPRHIRHVDFLRPEEIEACYRSADLIISHAGMGSILAALKHRKPIVILPRREALNEHRNDHQVATAKRFADKSGVFVAWDETEIGDMLDRRGELGAGVGISEFASPELLEGIARFIG